MYYKIIGQIKKKERFIRAMIYPPLPQAKLQDKKIDSMNELMVKNKRKIYFIVNGFLDLKEQ